MNLGILMSYFNQRYFRDTLSMVCEFIPQMIFLNALFGYLAFLIILKWCASSLCSPPHYPTSTGFVRRCGKRASVCPAAVHVLSFAEGYVSIPWLSTVATTAAEFYIHILAGVASSAISVHCLPAVNRFEFVNCHPEHDCCLISTQRTRNVSER